MIWWTTFIALVLGIAALYRGAIYFVDGSTGLAKRWGIPPIVIGFTLVAIGTSMPELVVNFIAALSGSGDLIVGNILGSNMANIGLVIGLAPLFAKELNWVGSKRRFELAGLMAAVALTYVVAFDGQISDLDGALLVLSGGLFLGALFWLNRADAGWRAKLEEAVLATGMNQPKLGIAVTATLVGVILLFVGGRLTVTGAVNLAQLLGLSEIIIGLTVTAIGTSLPELITSAVAIRRGESDLAIGNALGSNVLNLFVVFGAAALVMPIHLSQTVLEFDFLTLIGTTLLAVWVLRHDGRLRVWRTAPLILVYVFFLFGAVFLGH